MQGRPAPAAFDSQKYSKLEGGVGKILSDVIEFAGVSWVCPSSRKALPHILSEQSACGTSDLSPDRRRRPNFSQSHHLNDSDVTDFQGAVALAHAMGTPFNVGATINWPPAPGNLRPMDRFKDLNKKLRSQYRRWGIGKSYIYIIMHERGQKGQNEHSHVMLHLPPNGPITPKMLQAAIRRMVGVHSRNRAAVYASDYDAGWAVYLVKGCEPENRNQFAIRKTGIRTKDASSGSGFRFAETSIETVRKRGQIWTWRGSGARRSNSRIRL